VRRLLALVAFAGVAVACLVLPGPGPAAAQTALAIDNFSPRCANVEAGTTVSVNGRSSARSVSAVVYSPSGAALTKGSAVPSSGSYTITMSFTPGVAGLYEVRVNDSAGGQLSAYLEVPCQAPTLEYNPACFPVGYSGTVTMTGRHFVPYGTGYFTYDVGGSETQSQIRIPVDNRGVVSATFKVTPANRSHPGEVYDANRSLVATASWAPCPPGTTTSTTSVVIDTTTTAPPDTVPDATTTTRPGVPGATTTTSTTLPPSIDVPPPTPGATLTISPRIGPTGFVTGARGTGFPPGPVELHWSPGLGSTTTIAGPDGTFSVRVLVFPKDQLGPRALIATGGATTAYDGFLVVQSSVQPSSGRDVAQITRSRRFTQR
jgi:hypothetical protein